MRSDARRSRRPLPVRMAKLVAAALFGLSAAAGMAEELPALIRDAVAADPEILEARANEDVAGSRLEATRAQRLPVLGLQAGGNAYNPDKFYSTPFRGAVGKLNLYSAGAIGAQVERDELKLQFQRLRTEETRERVAYNVASLFLQALTAKELLATETANLARHQKIIDDLKVIVANDRGRRYELVQAESRGLQVREEHAGGADQADALFAPGRHPGQPAHRPLAGQPARGRARRRAPGLAGAGA